MSTLWKPAQLLGLFTFCVIPAACTSAGSEDAGAESGPGSLALLSVERSGDGPGEPSRLTAAAKIARFRGIDADGLLKLLGADARELETCGAAGALEDGAMSPNAQVDLLSVGSLDVRVGSTHHALAPRLFPALATTAAGFFYAGSTELADASSGSEEFALSARGEAGLGRFEIAGVTPSEVRGLALAGVLVDAGAVLTARGGAELTWEPESGSDRIEIEIFSAGSSLSCAVRDDGQFRITAAQLAALEADESASLVARRVRIVPIEMTGVESAYVRVAATRSLSLQVK
jgi:hypothetical protein